MDDHLNRAARTRRSQLVAFLLVSCCAESVMAGDAAADRNGPQRIAVQPPTRMARTESVEVRSLVIREPAAQPTLFSSPVALASPSRQPSALPGFSTESLRQSAAKSLDESAARLAHRANLSAAAAAIEALRFIAQSKDACQGTSQSTTNLDHALMAIREAEDFVGRYGSVDSNAISRMVRSHETVALKSADLDDLTSLVAADAYLVSASKMLYQIADSDPLACNAIGLLAKSYRQRANESPLALATAVHLMRAAADASPGDRGILLELVSVLDQAKLHQESQLALASAMQIPEPPSSSLRGADDQAVVAVVNGSDASSGSAGTQQAIRIEQLSPSAFAIASGVAAGPSGPPVMTTATNAAPAVPSEEKDKQEGNPVSRVFKSLTRGWR
jgi:hypothetical protein